MLLFLALGMLIAAFGRRLAAAEVPPHDAAARFTRLPVRSSRILHCHCSLAFVYKSWGTPLHLVHPSDTLHHSHTINFTFIHITLHISGSITPLPSLPGIMSSSVFSETLQAITTTKLGELSKKRTIFEESKSALIFSTEREQNQQQRLRILVDGVKQCFAVKTASRRRGDRFGGPGRIIAGSTNDPDLEVMLKNLERFLEQARFDPTISPKLLGDWENSVMKKLKVQSLKFEYATLYGELVNEWLRAEKAIPSDNASTTSEGFEKVNRAERDESRVNWEKLVFEPFETDPMAISEYLQTLFGPKGVNQQSVKALRALRKSVEAFETSLSTPGQFNDEVLRWTINGLMGSGLLSDEKRAVLKDFLASPVILAEVADVLNMRIATISTWSWEGEGDGGGVPVEQRRHVTGAYHGEYFHSHSSHIDVLS
jgi:hypothetical protein